MPVNCPVCGAPAQKGERFCSSCGAPLQAAPVKRNTGRNQRYFAPEEEAFYAAPPREEAYIPRPEERYEEARPKKSDRGLNLALLICTLLAVAVVTFVIILLLSGNGSGENGGSSVSFQPNPAVPTASAIPGVVPTADAEPGEDVVVITTPTAAPGVVPSVVPTTAPTAVPTIVPSQPPAPTPTPTPDPTKEYLLPDSNTRYLTEADLSGLTHEELCFARNEIFARHGRIFQTPQIAAYFNSKSWYKGTVSAANFSESVFNAYERANISLISEYEQKYYGGSYY